MYRVLSFVSGSVLALGCFLTPEVDAHFDEPLYDAACEYRDAVRDFERAVIRSRQFDSFQRRAVDRLEDATSLLRSYARHPERRRRLDEQWYEIQFLQQQVGRLIFGQPGIPIDGKVIQCWERVQHAFSFLSQQLTATPSVDARRLRETGLHETWYDGCPQHHVERLYGARPDLVQPNIYPPPIPRSVPSPVIPDLVDPVTPPRSELPGAPSPEMPLRSDAPQDATTVPPQAVQPSQLRPSSSGDQNTTVRSRLAALRSLSDQSLRREVSLRRELRSAAVRSPSSGQSSEVDRYGERVVTRGGFEMRSLGAVLSRLID